MVFPLLKFWKYTPLGFVCALIWNSYETLGLRPPYAPALFSKIVGVKGVKHGE